VGQKTTEKGFINPDFYIINHSEFDNIQGLYSVITGKMTLAFHASKSVSELILGEKLKLEIDCRNLLSKGITSELVPLAVEPWREPGEL